MRARAAVLLMVFACGEHGDPAAKHDDPVVACTTAVVRKGDVVDALTAYGMVVPAPGAALTITRPFETRVARILVTAGQRVSAKDPLIRFESSPDTRLHVDVASKAADAAKKNLDNVRHRFELGLATNADVLAAQQAVDQSQAELSSLGSRGAGRSGTIDTPKAGVVAVVHVQQGALVPAGQPLVEIVAENAIEAQVGVELARATQVHPGDSARVVAVARRDSPAEGAVRSVARAVDPATRLIPVMVTITRGELFLGEYVETTFPAAKHEGLLVPRSAVLPEGDKQILFTVVAGRAKKHVVRVGLETATETEIIADDVHAGDRVITVGNYGCADGAQVREATP